MTATAVPEAETGPDAFADALLAARLCAVDPAGLGGMILRGGGDMRDPVLDMLRACMPADAPERRLPGHIDEDRLLGGIDLTATLARGGVVMRRGLLAEADGGRVVIPMAERLPDHIVAHLAATLDSGTVRAARDGVMLEAPARLLLVAFDDGVEAEERVSDTLAERLAFHIRLDALSNDRRHRLDGDPISPPLLRLQDIEPPGDDVLTALVATAGMLGIESARAPIFALRAARASAVLAGRRTIGEADVMAAARLVLGPRATRLPAPPQADAPDETPDPPPSSGDAPPDSDGDDQSAPMPMEDVVLEAVMAHLPPDVLARIADGRSRQRAVNRARGAGERRKSAARGRPVGARAGVPGNGLRLSLIDTLRAAAPWQKLRGGQIGRVQVRRDDLRIRRFETRAEAVTIFAVDASGSSAVARLAEAKGAVERLLADAYVKRAQVALVAFRGTGADVLLPPTRSLTRARRSLGDLPGGGGTPLAAGLHAAHDVAQAARARGRSPFIVVLTDGRANVARDGAMVQAVAQADAETAARIIGASAIPSAFVDISPRPRREGAELAAMMGARYLPLPRGDAAAMHAAVVAVQKP
ncbi:magnesium chelatase subunit D [Sphingobium algorifonticola]|uniref:Magnesium chelatase subunit D n=1 Tax=Sphingobium algorifonticola TaxID=2008318 RepID=A0A437J607_9SPHN|nr:magnesium chelatase subunit D [Sphingobium algorifonticola]RVT40234.1 magnesium chelatase subunit D [Sphingobium algorifonticola]